MYRLAGIACRCRRSVVFPHPGNPPLQMPIDFGGAEVRRLLLSLRQAKVLTVFAVIDYRKEAVI